MRAIDPTAIASTLPYPSISVIIPALDEERALPATLEHVRAAARHFASRDADTLIPAHLFERIADASAGRDMSNIGGRTALSGAPRGTLEPRRGSFMMKHRIAIARIALLPFVLGACVAATQRNPPPSASEPPAPARTVQSDRPTTAAPGRPRVAVIGTGGTIAGRSSGRTSFQNYRSGQIPIDSMVAELRPDIDEVADISSLQFGNRASGSYSVADFFELSLAIDSALETADAVVVTTGTDTMEEFVYWMDLTVRSQKPVVFTGAMRPWTVVGSDAQPNLFNAIVLAASGATTCFGTVLMLNDEFHAAKDVWKSNGSRLDTFISGRFGILGSVDGRRVRTFRAPPRVQSCDEPERWRTPFDLRTLSADGLPRVEMLLGYQGARLDEAAIALADAGVDGIITALGGISGDARRYAQDKGVVFVSTQRLRTGGDNLLPQKARLLLLLALAFSDDADQARRWVRELGALEFEPASARY